MAQKKNPYQKKNFKQKEVTFETPGTKALPLSSKNELNLQLIVLFIFGLALYLNTLTFGYTLDDRLMITDNKFTKEGIHGIKHILSNDAFVGFFGENKNLLPGGRYRPLSQIMFAIEYRMFGLSPFVGHLINILMYAALGVLVFLVLRKLLEKYKGTVWYLTLPFVATLIYIAHPIHTEVVANIKGRDEILTSICVFGSIWFTLKYLDTNKIWLLILSFISFFLALMSKENAITFLAVIPLAIYFFTKHPLKKNIITLIPLLIATVLFMFARYKALGFFMNPELQETELLNNPYLFATKSERYATIFYTMGKYIQLLFLPHPLTHDYYPKQIPIINWSDMRAIVPLLMYLGMAIFAVWGLIKKNYFAFFVILFAATFSIASNLVFNVGTFMNERFMFVPSLGFACILAYFLIIGLQKLMKTTGVASVSKVLLVAILVGYSIKTFTRNFAWKDDLTLFTTDAKTSENSAKVNVSAGGMLIEKSMKEKDENVKRQQLTDATVYLKKGVNIHPKYVAGWVLLGNAYLYLEDWENSFICYDNSLRIAPKYKDALNNMLCLAQRTYKATQYSLSISAYKRLIKLEPGKIANLFDLAVVYDDAGKLDSAMALLDTIVKRKPEYYQAYNRIGQIYGKKKNDLVTSIKYLMKAYELSPKDPSTLENLGVANGIMRNFKESILYFEKAAAVSPKNVQIYQNMGNSYMQSGNKAKAQECFAKAQQLAIENKKSDTTKVVR